MGLLQGSDATTSRFELQPPGSLIHRQHVTAAAAAQHRREEAGGQALPASRDRAGFSLGRREGNTQINRKTPWSCPHTAHKPKMTLAGCACGKKNDPDELRWMSTLY